MTDKTDDTDDVPKLNGTDPISLRGFLRDLTYNEIHLFWMGLYAGFVAIRPRTRQEPKPAVKEKLQWDVNQWYFQTGYIVGYLLKVAVVAGASLEIPEIAQLVGL